MSFSNYLLAVKKAIQDIEVSNIRFHDVVNNLEDIFFKNKSPNNLKVRDKYNNKVSALFSNYRDIIKSYHDKDLCFDWDLAQEISAKRNLYKSESQLESSFVSRVTIYIRNLKKYGDPIGPNSDVSSLKTISSNPEDVAYRAFKTDGKDLNLANNGFSKAYEKWASEGFDDCYPEMIISGECGLEVQ